MPTFTAISLDRLLEPASRNPTIPKPPPVKLSPRPTGNRPLIASPALYTTPATTPLPDSPCSFPPSPYIINHKRRGPRLQKPPPSLEAKEVLDSNDEAKNIDENLGSETTIASFELGNGVAQLGDVLKLNSDDAQRDGDIFRLNSDETEIEGEAEDFYDLLESMSSASNIEGDDSLGNDPLQKPESATEEFYTAYDELSSDDASRSPFRKCDDEVREMRLSLLMEIEKRKQAEEAVENFHKKWQNLCQHLSAVGLVLPNFLSPLEEEAIVDPIEDLGQQIVVARAVTTSIARGCARAEAEMEIEPQIVAKNFEIARLLDRLHYYETANKEMSQRNQEAVENARQRRYRRNKRQKWFWGSIGLALTLSTAAIAWSYLPSSKPLPSLEDSTNDH